MSFYTLLHQQHQQEQHAKLILPLIPIEKAMKSDVILLSLQSSLRGVISCKPQLLSSAEKLVSSVRQFT